MKSQPEAYTKEEIRAVVREVWPYLPIQQIDAMKGEELKALPLEVRLARAERQAERIAAALQDKPAQAKARQKCQSCGRPVKVGGVIAVHVPQLSGLWKVEAVLQSAGTWGYFLKISQRINGAKVERLIAPRGYEVVSLEADS